MGCPRDYTHEAVYPADLRASFVDKLQPGVAALVAWDACNASNPLELPQRLDIQDDCIIFEPTGFSLDKDRSVVLISASSGRTVEAVLGLEPAKVQCGPLCWAFFTFISFHLKGPVGPEDILKVFIKYVRYCCEGKKDLIPQAGVMNTMDLGKL
ncbi:hypothetical protein FRC05_003074 [Tulasnella sp. 425]|nr:hypothetical protein FRC05_003074 [Tulasnella sp. 425]